MNLLDLGVFFGISFLAAAVNSVAGGGTFLTFPVFILNGLSALQANIMSTIALWPGVLASAHGYRKVLVTSRKQLVPFIGIGLAGGAIGAALLLSTSEIVFEQLVPWLMLAATLIFSFGKFVIGWINKLFPGRKEYPRASYAMQFCTAVYGGYFGAGIGILTLAMLQLMGLNDIHRMNALKTILTAAINTMTFAIFLFSGQVVWSLVPVMVAGAVTGGYVGAHMALKVSPEKVRLLVIVIAASMTGYFFIR